MTWRQRGGYGGRGRDMEDMTTLMRVTWRGRHMARDDKCHMKKGYVIGGEMSEWGIGVER
jgi:hypothetical protein